MSLHFSKTNCVLLASPELKRQLLKTQYTRCLVTTGGFTHPSATLAVVGAEKTATAFKDTALDVLRMMFHLFKEGKDNRNYIYFPINNDCTKCSECNVCVKIKKDN